MSDTTSTPSSPTSSASTLPSSAPSPELNTLSLTEERIPVSEADIAAAAALKAQANKAFTSEF